MISDRGTSFTAAVFTIYCEKQEIQHIIVFSRHSQINRQVERVHSILI